MVFNYKCTECGCNSFTLLVPGLNHEDEIYQCLNCQNLIMGSALQFLEVQVSRIDNNNSAKTITRSA